jgi:hypothetical protein
MDPEKRHILKRYILKGNAARLKVFPQACKYGERSWRFNKNFQCLIIYSNDGSRLGCARFA